MKKFALALLLVLSGFTFAAKAQGSGTPAPDCWGRDDCRYRNFDDGYYRDRDDFYRRYYFERYHRDWDGRYRHEWDERFRREWRREHCDWR